MSRISDHATLTAGSWPTADRSSGPDVQAAVPAAVAQALHLRIGQVLALRDRQTGIRVAIAVIGLYQPQDPASQYWHLDLIPPSGISVQNHTISYGPFVVAGAAFTSHALAVDGVTWLATLGTTRIGAGQLTSLAQRISSASAHLTRSSYLGGLQVASDLPGVLSRIAAKLVVARSLLIVSGIELLLLAGAALTLTVRTLSIHRENEAALLTARGAGRWQLARIALTEALTLTVVGAAVGALAGSWLAGRLSGAGGAPPATDFATSGIGGQVWWTAGIVPVICIAILVWPALHPVDPGTARVRKGRQAIALAAARAGGDLALVALAVLAGWQLHDYSVLGRTPTGLGIDPVLAIAPAVILAAATVLPLRLLPLAARAADRLAARSRRLGAAMPSWEISRHAARQSASMLLIVLAVGTGTLALAQHQSWSQSASDQSAFAAGADVRATVPAPLPLGRAAVVARAHGVTAAMPVSTDITATNGQVLAVDPQAAGRTVLIRADQSALPLANLWRLLGTQGKQRSVPIPGRPARLEITASLATGRGQRIGEATVSVSVQDGAGIVYTVPAGTLMADAQPHPLIVQLSARRQAIYPLRLVAITAGYTEPMPPPAGQTKPALARVCTFTVHALATSAAPSGPFRSPFTSGDSLAAWQPSVSAPDLALSATGVRPTLVANRHSTAGTTEFHPGYGQIAGGVPPHVVLAPVSGQLTLIAPAPLRAIPGIATTAFLRTSQLRVGDVLPVDAGSTTAQVRIVAAVASFPTVTGNGGALVVGERAVQDVVAAHDAAPLLVTQWWLTTRTGAAPPGLPAGTIVADRDSLRAALLSEPMSGVAQRAVQALAIAAALLAVLGFTVSVAGSVRERRGRSALLAALGVNAAARARLLCAEVLALSVPAAITGLLLGTVLARLLVPAVTVTPSGSPPVPPALVVVPLGQAALLAVLVSAIPVIAAAATAAYRPDPAAELRASEAV